MIGDVGRLAVAECRERLNIKEAKTVVYVISKNGTPIMPTTDHRKVRLLLKNGKARVVRRDPFTVQVLSTTHTYIQDVTLGVDAGSKHVGMSATTTKQELLVGELQPRNDVVDLMSTRREARGARRNRTTPYRKPRFNNRVKSKHRGWLAPSVEVKIWNHIQGVTLFTNLLPISKIVVETGEFDLQRMKAMEQGKPLPVGTDYQLGEQYDFYNVRQYVLHRDGYKCKICGARSTGKKPVKFHVHHVESRKVGGDAPSNLVTLCEHCHRSLHEGMATLPEGWQKRRTKSTRDTAFMGIMRETLIQRLREKFPGVEICETRGYITKYWRERIRLPKSHTNDAFVISKNIGAKRISEEYLMVPKRRHNRQIHKFKIQKKGRRRLNQSPRFVCGFQLFDKVEYNGETGFIFGRRIKGYFDIRDLSGVKIHASANVKKISLVRRRRSLLIEKRAAPPTT